MVRILLLEDERVLRDELAEVFRASNYLVETAPDLVTFWRLWTPSAYQIAIIDLELADGDGIDLVRALRRSDNFIGIIIYTACSQSFVAGLNGGADHYLVKPMHLSELLASVNSLSRRLGCCRANETWVIDGIRRQLVAPCGVAAPLSARDYLVMRALMEGQGHLVTRRQIIMALDEDYLSYDQRRLDTQIRRLRVKAEECLGRKLPLNTVHGMGYMFAAPAMIQP